MASEVLKHVDQLIKAKDLQEALFETTYARKIDPQNVYVLALEERIKDLLTVQSKTKQQKEQIKNQPGLATETQKKCAKEKSSQLPAAFPHNINQTTTSVTNTVPHIKQSIIPTICRIPNDVQQQRLFASADDSKKKGSIDKMKQPPKVVMIDDDKDLLSVLSLSLESCGFEAIPLSTSDEAYVLLKKFTPDIILCDINLETSTMGGFTFFEKIQEIEHLKEVPFIFLSGLNDDLVVRTGKEMGADDYLTKPIKEQNLLAALRGKLKRFEQLREMQSVNIHNYPASSPLCERHS